MYPAAPAITHQPLLLPPVRGIAEGVERAVALEGSSTARWLAELITGAGGGGCVQFRYPNRTSCLTTMLSRWKTWAWSVASTRCRAPPPLALRRSNAWVVSICWSRESAGAAPS